MSDSVNENRDAEFDYEALWNKEEKKVVEKKIDDLPQGLPRTGLKGKYIQRKDFVSKKRIGISYGKYIKEVKEKDV